MSRRSGVSAVEVLVFFIVVVVIAAILWPLFTYGGRCPPLRASPCQSNLTQIGRAIKMYMSDWDNTYPTQCLRPASMAFSVKLSPREEVNQKRFVHGTNWVEALFSYIETTSKNDAWSVWRCGACSDDTYPKRSDTAAVSYVLNRNLIQLPEGYVTDGARLMLLREADRLVNSDLRPTNLSRKNEKAMPQSPFLTKRDVRMGETKPDLHNKGSHVLFADGHVKYFGAESYTDKPSWDPETQQWWNYVKGHPGIDKAIAITP